MKVALDKVIEIVTDCKPHGETDISSTSIFHAIKEFKVRTENISIFFLSMLREHCHMQSP